MGLVSEGGPVTSTLPRDCKAKLGSWALVTRQIARNNPEFLVEHRSRFINKFAEVSRTAASDETNAIFLDLAIKAEAVGPTLLFPK